MFTVISCWEKARIMKNIMEKSNEWLQNGFTEILLIETDKFGIVGLFNVQYSLVP